MSALAPVIVSPPSPESQPAPSLRLLPAPIWPSAPDHLGPSRPDLDEQNLPTQRPDQPALPLDFCLPSGLPAVPSVPAVPDLVVRHPRSSIVPWAARLAQAVLEVVAAERPVTQLTSWVNLEIYRRLERRHQLRARQVDPTRPRDRTADQVRSVHVCHPTPSVAEVSVVTSDTQRCRALALRLEHRQGRWFCTELDWV